PGPSRPLGDWGGEGSPGCGAYLSSYSRTLSFTSPATLRDAPFALSALPLAFSFSSPITLPAVSLTAPLAFSAAALMCSRSICALHYFTAYISCENAGEQRR